jgi:DNA-binding transcriptional LysR family regulator
MDTTWLVVFRQIARTGSFTAAAEDLGYTQSATSRQIAALERYVGATLFERRARGVRLTEAGRFFLPHAEAVLDRLDAAVGDVDAVQRAEAGRLRIGGFATAGSVLLPRAISAFRAAYPGVVLTHSDGRSQHLAVALERDELDLALLNGYPDQVGDYAHLRPVHLLDEPMLVAVPQGHRLAGAESARLPDLVDEDWIAGSASAEETLIRAAWAQGFRPRIAHVVREWIAKLGFVAENQGVTLIPAIAAASVRSDVSLVRLDDSPTRIVLVARSPDREVPAVDAFITHLKRTAEELATSWASQDRA